MTAPTYFGSGTAVAGISDISVPWPPGHVTGDVGILIIGTSTAGAGNPTTISVSGSTGFTQIADTPYSFGATGEFFSNRLQTLYKRAGSSTEPAVLLTLPGANAQIMARIAVFRGVITGSSPINVFATDIDAAGSGVAMSAPSITTTSNDCAYLNCLVYGDQDWTITLGTNANLSGITKQWEFFHDSNPVNFHNDRKMVLVTATAATAGVLGTLGHTLNSGTGSGVVHTIALSPVPVSPTFVFPYTPVREGYTNTFGLELNPIKLDGGLSRIRRQLLERAHVVTVQWILDSTEYTKFMGFFHSDLSGGVEDFFMDVVTDIGIPTRHLVRLIGGMPKLIRQSGEAYWVTATLECDKNPTTTGNIIYTEAGLVAFGALNPRMDEGFEVGDSLQIIDSSGIHPTGNTPLNLDGVYEVSNVANHILTLLSPGSVNNDWNVLAALGTGMEYGDVSNGNVISTITRVPGN